MDQFGQNQFAPVKSSVRSDQLLSALSSWLPIPELLPAVLFCAVLFGKITASANTRKV
jgi:hypothetical protein